MKPLIKWVGGKSSIINIIIDSFPKEINNYHEIFVGGGSVLIALLESDIKLNGSINAYDLNETLIEFYKNIQMNSLELFNTIEKIIKEYEKIPIDNDREYFNKNCKNLEEAILSRENYYYWIRKQYNLIKSDNYKSLKRSSMFYFLNKTCFRGLYRIGPNGFNVPYGHYKTVPKLTLKEIQNMKDLIQNVNFKCCDFKESLSNVSINDFVYLDPPYVPENKKSFVGYNINGFSKDQHLKLFKICNNIIIKKNITFIMSNSNTKLVRESFKDSSKFEIKEIECRRSINSKNPGSKIIEVIISSIDH